MVNKPNPVPPPGSGPGGTPDVSGAGKKHKNTGEYQSTGPHQFLGMTFEAKDWDKFMNILIKNLNDYINKTFQKMTERMKKDWKRSQGEEVDD